MRYLYALILFFSLISSSFLNALDLNRVILSTNNNPLYIEFWPVVAPLWEAMGLRPTLAFVADETCSVDETLGDVIRFSPQKDVSEAMQAQAIRLFLPALFPDDGCLIADIDMLPISRSYFFSGAASCPDRSFLVYRDQAFEYWGMRYPMCYVAAKGKVFGSVFGISTKEDMTTRLREWAALDLGWNTDEIMLYQSIQSWGKNGGHLFCLGHGVGPRLDRADWDRACTSHDVTGYIDCHCPRPYSAYRHSIDQIVETIHQQLR